MAVCLDRFAQGLRDAQDVEAVNECDACGRDIYRGERYYLDYDGEPLCAECAREYVERRDLEIGDLISEIAGEEVAPWVD